MMSFKEYCRMKDAQKNEGDIASELLGRGALGIVGGIGHGLAGAARRFGGAALGTLGDTLYGAYRGATRPEDMWYRQDDEKERDARNAIKRILRGLQPEMQQNVMGSFCHFCQR